MNLHISKQKLPPERWQIAVDIGSVLVTFGLFFYVWSQMADMPNLVPTHFNIRGIADQFGQKSSLYILPGVALFVQFMTMISRIDPRFMNLPVGVTEANAEPIFRVASRMMSGVQLLVTLLFADLVLQTVTISKQQRSSLLLFPLFSFIALMLVLILISSRRMRKIAKDTTPAKE